MQPVRTVSFPDRQLLADLSPLPEGLRGVVWDMKSDPDGRGRWVRSTASSSLTSTLARFWDRSPKWTN